MDPIEIAISVEHIHKVYKLYDSPADRLRDALHLTRKKHKMHHALNDVNIEVKRGETVGIIGTNGSGKSTLLKIITGVLSPTDGAVKVNGRISALLELGAGFNMEYTGIENIYLNGTMIGFTEEEIKERMDAILEFADIGDFVYQPVKTYSSGMFVRLAFAVAINIDPEILIVDEALSVGDVFFQTKCYHKFEEFKEKGKTILFVSHDLSSIAKYCDRVVLLDRGVKLQEGTPKQVIDSYKKVLVGQFTNEDEEKLEEFTGDFTEPSKKSAGKSVLPIVPGYNPDCQQYGSKKAEITAITIKDEAGKVTNTLLKGSEFCVTMDTEFHEKVPAPIFALSIKDIKGTEITGTNTMIEKICTEAIPKGEKRRITFTQRIDLQGGEYLLSFGLTGFEKDDFTVYHRLYDAINISVVSTKNTVGYYDMNSVVMVTKIESK